MQMMELPVELRSPRAGRMPTGRVTNVSMRDSGLKGIQKSVRNLELGQPPSLRRTRHARLGQGGEVLALVQHTSESPRPKRPAG